MKETIEEIIQNPTERDQEIKLIRDTLRDMEDKMKRSNMHLTRVKQGEERMGRMIERKEKRISRMMKDTTLQGQEGQCIPSWKN